MRREKENWRLFEHKAYPRMGPVDLQFCFEHYMKLYALKNRNFQACVVVCNLCKATWFLQPGSTLPAHYNNCAGAHVWPLCW